MNLEQLLMMTIPSKNWKGESVEISPDFRIAVQKYTKEGIHIIIHPSGVSGDTLDFFVNGDTLTPVYRGE